MSVPAALQLDAGWRRRETIHSAIYVVYMMDYIVRYKPTLRAGSESSVCTQCLITAEPRPTAPRPICLSAVSSWDAVWLLLAAVAAISEQSPPNWLALFGHAATGLAREMQWPTQTAY
jgi:hypothetical protein